MFEYQNLICDVKQAAMKLCINNKANHQDYNEFQEFSKEQLKEYLDSLHKKYENIYSLYIAIEFIEDHLRKENFDALKPLNQKDLERLRLTKNKNNYG